MTKDSFDDQNSSNSPPEQPGFSVRTILISLLWTIALATALGFAVKFGHDLSGLVGTQHQAPRHEGPVRIGVFSWAGYYPLVTAQELGLFKKHGVDVELAHAKTIGELNDWIRTGRTQVSVGVLVDFIILRSLGTPIRMMVATDFSIADVILSRRDIKTPKDLIGKRIGISELSSFAEYFVVRSLELAGVDPSEVYFRTVLPDEIPSAIIRGDIDAGHTWNPALQEGLQRGLTPLLSSSQNPRLVLDGIVFRAEVTQDHEIPIGIIRAFFEALALQKTDPVAFAGIPAKYFGITREQAQKFIDEDAHFTDLDENIRLYAPQGTLRKEAILVSRFFAERGMGSDASDVDALIDDTVIRRIEDERAIGLSTPIAPRRRSKSSVSFGTRESSDI